MSRLAAGRSAPGMCDFTPPPEPMLLPPEPVVVLQGHVQHQHAACWLCCMHATPGTGCGIWSCTAAACCHDRGQAHPVWPPVPVLVLHIHILMSAGLRVLDTCCAGSRQQVIMPSDCSTGRCLPIADSECTRCGRCRRQMTMTSQV